MEALGSLGKFTDGVKRYGWHLGTGRNAYEAVVGNLSCAGSIAGAMNDPSYRTQARQELPENHRLKSHRTAAIRKILARCSQSGSETQDKQLGGRWAEAASVSNRAPSNSR